MLSFNPWFTYYILWAIRYIQSVREHLGLLHTQKPVEVDSPTISVEDPVCDDFYLDTWVKTAHSNTEIFEQVRIIKLYCTDYVVKINSATEVESCFGTLYVVRFSVHIKFVSVYKKRYCMYICKYHTFLIPTFFNFIQANITIILFTVVHMFWEQ